MKSWKLKKIWKKIKDNTDADALSRLKHSETGGDHHRKGLLDDLSQRVNRSEDIVDAASVCLAVGDASGISFIHLLPAIVE